MPKKNPKVAERNAAIIHRWLTADPQPTVLELATEHGLDPGSIRNLLSKAGAKSRRGPGCPSGAQSPKAFTKKPPLSRLHHQIGVKVDAQRNFAARAKVIDIGEALRMSSSRLRAAELGCHDFTLSELQRISEWLKVPLPQLVTEVDLAKPNSSAVLVSCPAISSSPTRGTSAVC